VAERVERLASPPSRIKAENAPCHGRGSVASLRAFGRLQGLKAQGSEVPHHLAQIVQGFFRVDRDFA
jgi:hypothetical protein